MVVGDVPKFLAWDAGVYIYIWTALWTRYEISRLQIRAASSVISGIRRYGRSHLVVAWIDPAV